MRAIQCKQLTKRIHHKHTDNNNNPYKHYFLQNGRPTAQVCLPSAVRDQIRHSSKRRQHKHTHTHTHHQPAPHRRRRRSQFQASHEMKVNLLIADCNKFNFKMLYTIRNVPNMVLNLMHNNFSFVPFVVVYCICLFLACATHSLYSISVALSV